MIKTAMTTTAMTTCLRRTTAALLIGAAAVVGLGSAAAAHAETTGMHGDPGSAAQYWSEQNYDDCAIMASAHVVGILTGEVPDEEDIIAVAGSTPSDDHPGSIYVVRDDGDLDHGGTSAEDLPILLAHYGIDATYTDTDTAADGGLQTGLPALESYLDNSQAVIAIVNANTIWQLPDDGNGSHALVVTGVDTANNVVHLNDSGIDNGADEQVSVAAFQSAWNDMDQEMVVAS